MVKINQKGLDKIVQIASLAGRYNELQRLEGQVPSSLITRRKTIIKSQLQELLKDKEEEKETTMNIRIEIPTETEKSKKEAKENCFSLSSLLGKKYANDESDEISIFLGDAFDGDTRGIIKKIVTEI